MTVIYFISTSRGLVAPDHVEAVLIALNKITVCLASGRELAYDGREARNIYSYLSTYSYASTLDPHRPPADNTSIFYTKPEEGGPDEG